MVEIPIISLVYNVGKDLFRFILGKFQKPDPERILELRAKWEAEIEEKLQEYRLEGFTPDIIVHDLARMDMYPDKNSKKGISPWFRAGLMDTYHRGVLLGIGWESLIEDKGKWRKAQQGEDGAVTVCLTGRVPYENIVSINWDGDTYYSKPHFFCHFNRAKKQPYEDVVYCNKITIVHVPDMPPYPHFYELVKWEEVEAATKDHLKQSKTIRRSRPAVAA